MNLTIAAVYSGGMGPPTAMAALRGVGKIEGLTRDEYPFASSVEGGAGAWVGHVPARQQRAQGALIAEFIRKNNFMPGDRYRVVVE
jgi:hypothetical protein